MLVEPDRGVGREACDVVGTVVVEVGLQQFAEQVVLAVPDTPVVERDHEAVCAFERGQDRRRVGSAEDGIAQRPAESLEERRPTQERDEVRPERFEDLRPEVVGDGAGVAGQVRGGRVARVGDRQDPKVQPGRPALGVPVQLCGGRLVDPVTQRVRKLERLQIVEAEIDPIELQQRSLGSPARESDGRRSAACDHEP